MRLLIATMVCTVAITAYGQNNKRPLRVSDLYQVRDIEDPQRSPDGQWVAYTVTAADSTTDKNHTDVWMVRWDGSQTIQLTSGPDGAGSPRWSPDGKYIGFLSSRGDSNETSQLWLLNRQGGEGERVTQLTGDVEDYAWAPDGKHIVLAVTDEPEDSTKAAKAKKPKPIVIDRYQFKQDVVGYMGKKRTHLYLFDVETKKAEIITPGPYDEEGPVWSPDGSKIAFASKRFPTDVDRANNWDVFVMDAKPGAPAKQLTTSPGQDGSPERGRVAWSPDGNSIAYLAGSADPKLFAYDQFVLNVIPSSGGEPRTISKLLDRPISDPRWSKDGNSIIVLVTDDRSQYPARIDVASGQVTRLLPGQLVVNHASLGSDDAMTALVTTDTTPAEIFAIDHGALRQLTHANDAWLAGVQLSAAEEFASKSKDGADVHGLVIKPVGYMSGKKYPTLLRIHGGPEGQDQHEFSFERQLFAANGYAVIETNYRGSNGRGQEYEKAILADWGHKEVIDLLGAVDHVIAMGIADTSKLGIGGWSYGGILTDYTIASDHRFKAATSGAGSALQLAMYGVDEYITQYVAELGQPWEHPELWVKVSYPFFHANKITTPTLFLGGDQDYNVPLIGGEQMYQALRALGVPSELIIYPGAFHGITRPSFRTDRLQRYLDWYANYLKPGATTTAATQ